MTLYDPKVREYALRVQYGTEATKSSVPSSIGGQWEPASFRPPSTWHVGLFYQDQWYADRGYYQLTEVPELERLAVPNDDANWEFRDGAMFNKISWTWKPYTTTSTAEYRVVYAVLFGSPTSLTAWEFIELRSMIKLTKGSTVSIGSGNIRIIPDSVFSYQ